MDVRRDVAGRSIGDSQPAAIGTPSMPATVATRQGVERGLLERLVADDGRDGPQVDGRRAVRQEDRDGVVMAGIADRERWDGGSSRRRVSTPEAEPGGRGRYGAGTPPTLVGVLRRGGSTMTDEARLEDVGTGLAPVTPGWFVVNAGDAAWVRNAGLAAAACSRAIRACCRNGPTSGAAVRRVRHHAHGAGARQAVGPVPRRVGQEDFLVLAGECLLVIEDQERRLRAWDFVHCPAGRNHVFVGAGDGPCVILMIGARPQGRTIAYPRSEPACDTARASRRPPTRPPRPTPRSHPGGWRVRTGGRSCPGRDEDGRAMTATREAACSCGQLRLVATGDPFVVSMCHCLACQRRTGTAFGLQAAFSREQVQTTGRAHRVPADLRRGRPQGGRLPLLPCLRRNGLDHGGRRARPRGRPRRRVRRPDLPAPSESMYPWRQHGWLELPGGRPSDPSQFA